MIHFPPLLTQHNTQVALTETSRDNTPRNIPESNALSECTPLVHTSPCVRGAHKRLDVIHMLRCAASLPGMEIEQIYGFGLQFPTLLIFQHNSYKNEQTNTL